GRRLARERNSAIFGKRMPAMTGQAAIVVVGAGDQEPSTVAEHLNRRYGAEYDVIVEQSAALGLERLMSLRDQGRDVAIVLADKRLPDGPGIAFLSQAQGFHPDAKR